MEQIIGQLCAAFDVDKPTAKGDTEEMIRDLLAREAIIEA